MKIKKKIQKLVSHTIFVGIKKNSLSKDYVCTIKETKYSKLTLIPIKNVNSAFD